MGDMSDECEHGDQRAYCADCRSKDAQRSEG